MKRNLILAIATIVALMIVLTVNAQPPPSLFQSPIATPIPWYDYCPGLPDCPVQEPYPPEPTPTCLPTPACPPIVTLPTLTPYPTQPPFDTPVPDPGTDTPAATATSDTSPLPTPTATPSQLSTCTCYVDNTAEEEGDGSWANPWKRIYDHIDDLVPGDAMCIRGNLTLPGRVYTDYIHLEGYSIQDGTAAQPITIRTFPGEQVIIRFPDEPLLRFQDVAYWHVVGFVLDGDGDEAHIVEFEDDAHHNVLRHCEITNGAQYGVRLKYSDYNVIEDCEIHGFDKGPYQDAHGIMPTDSNYNIIRRNEIYDCTGDGIQVGPADNQGNVIENNHFYTTLGPCSENAIDVKGGSLTIRNNVMHGFRFNDGSCGGSGSGDGAAIVVHMEAGDVLIEGNEIFDNGSGIRILSGEHVQVIGNVIRDVIYDPDSWADFGIQVHRPTTMEVYNNTLVNIPQTALLIGAQSGLSFHNNLFVNTGQIIFYDEGLAHADYNGWFGAAEQLDGPHDTVGDDPRFISPGDYHLKADSPARDAGIDVGLPYFGEAPDLGAYEFQQDETPTPTPNSTPTTTPTPTPTATTETSPLAISER